MKNVIACKNCQQENPLYNFICLKCNSYLRERIVNIDLWSTIGLLIESPSKAFKNIIHAEHKNFIFFLYFLVSIKFFINTLILAEPVFGNSGIFGYLSITFMVSLVAPLVLFFLFSWLFTMLTKAFHVKTRFKDNLSIIIYSQFPHIIGLVFLFPVEMVLFGAFLFTSNPSPFILKPGPALIISILELLMMLWSAILIFFAIKVTSKSVIYSIIVTLLLSLFINGIFLLSAALIR
ncbi:MAG: YIP1 family protein [Methanococcaceae archaeon]